MIAKIAVAAATFAIDKPYSYFIPEGMELTPGMRVRVPFGRGNRLSEGVVLSLEEAGPQNLKPIESCLDEQSLLDMGMLRLAAFLRERYFCTFYDAIRVLLPGGLWFHTRESYALTEDRSWQEKSLRQKDAEKLLRVLSDLGGTGEGSVLRQTVADEETFEAAVRYLLKKKWITASRELRRNVSDKTEKIATLSASVEEVRHYADSRPKSAAVQRSVLELLCNLGSVSVKELCYYTGAKSATVRRLEQLGYLELTDRPVLRCREIVPAKIPEKLILNPEQQCAFEGLSRQLSQDQPGQALLYGVTGSGKTSVYIQLIKKCLEQGASAMLLVPEIALTPQLLGLLAAYFGEQVAVLHSSLSPTERYDQWKRVRSGSARVVVGTRSAVFAPCQNLKLMILDEEQEHSYRSEQPPRYDAREVALWRGAREQALVLLGSATPSIETMYQARKGVYRLYTLKNRFNGRPLPRVEMVDMRQELKEGNGLSISTDLQIALRETADREKQTILFLNRRGNSRALVCVDCREAPECPRCSARLTYHSANHRLMCHYCGHSQPTPKRCPQCDGPLKAVGVGTQKVQQELNMLFPDLEIARMDADTVSAVNTHEKILDHFKTDNVPVLIGTQMVAKGLDIPNVTLVGVLDADLSLYADTYRAAETTFNMITQVVGRAGRGEDPGTAMIQTLVPEHQVLKLAAQQDYDGFYDLEIALRYHQQYPPFSQLLSVTFTGQEEAQVLRSAVKFRDSLAQCQSRPAYRDLIHNLLGPAPCPVPKINYHYRYRLTLRCRLNKDLRGLVAYLLQQFAKDKATRGVTAFADINPMD
jgi:primosomal protein N' (replication factor Y)